jgi:hypothetical protein
MQEDDKATRTACIVIRVPRKHKDSERKKSSAETLWLVQKLIDWSKPIVAIQPGVSLRDSSCRTRRTRCLGYLASYGSSRHPRGGRELRSRLDVRRKWQQTLNMICSQLRPRSSCRDVSHSGTSRLPSRKFFLFSSTLVYLIRRRCCARSSRSLGLTSSGVTSCELLVNCLFSVRAPVAQYRMHLECWRKHACECHPCSNPPILSGSC